MTGATERPLVRRPLVGAWVSVALVPVVVLAFSLVSILAFRGARYGVEGPPAVLPVWAQLLVLLVAFAVVGLPCAAALVLGRRAVSAGDRRGRVPMVLGVLAWLGYVALCALTFVGGLL